MLQELFNLVKDVASQNQTLPSTQKDDIAAETTNTVASGMRNMVSGGGIGSLLSMFSDNDDQKSGNGLMSNPMVSMMVGHLTEKLISKYNLNGQEANNVASGIIPEVLGNLINKSKDPGDNSFSLEKLLNSITGGKVDEVLPQQSSSNGSGGLQDILNQLGGGSSNSGGGGLMDIISKLAGGAQQQQQRNGGGGLMDLIRGFIR